MGMSAGIYLFGMRVMRSQPKFQPEKDGAVSITDGKGKKQEGLDYDKVTSKMNLIEDIIGQTFLYDEDAEAVEDYIYRGMLAGLDDPYSVYYSAADYQSMMETTQGEYSGIGAMISQNRTTGLCTIVKVFEGSPALEAGMQPGDIIFFQGTYATSGASHVGIYIGNGQMVHSGNPNKISDIYSSYFQQHWMCVARW